MTPLRPVPTKIPEGKQHTEYLTEEAIRAASHGEWDNMVVHLAHACFAGMLAQGVSYERARELLNRLIGAGTTPPSEAA